MLAALRRNSGERADALLRIAVVVGLLAVWELAARTNLINAFLFGSPFEVVKQLAAWLREGIFFPAVAVTLSEAFLGYLIAVLLGLCFGIATALMPRVNEVVSPYVTMFNALPRLMLAPILLVWFGFGLTSKIIFVVLVVFFIIYFGVLSGMAQVSSTYLDATTLQGANRWHLLRHVYLPASIGWIAASMRVGIGHAFSAAVVSEYLGSTDGLGYLITYGQNVMLASYVYAGVTALVILAITLDWAVRLLQRRMTPWEH